MECPHCGNYNQLSGRKYQVCYDCGEIFPIEDVDVFNFNTTIPTKLNKQEKNNIKSKKICKSKPKKNQQASLF